MTLDNMQSLPVGEMLTLKVDSKNVNLFLTNIVCDLQKLNSGKSLKLPQIFSTDFTFVLLGNCRKIAAEKYVAETFVAVVLSLVKCRTKKQIEDHWGAMVHVFGSKVRKEKYQYIIEGTLTEEVDCEYQSVKELLIEVGQENENEHDYLCRNQIKKSSKFYQYFHKILDEIMSKEENLDIMDNIFYCPSLLTFLVENYLPLFPLISLYFIPNMNVKDLPSSSSVENHWRSVKLFFKQIPLGQRYVNVYFPMILSYFNAKTEEFCMMKKNKSLYNRLSNKRKFRDPNIFYPNFEIKRRRSEATEHDYNEEDGYTLRKNKKEKSCKFVGRRIDFETIEKNILDSKSVQRDRKMTDKANATIQEIPDKTKVKRRRQKNEPSKIDIMLGLPLKKITETPVRKRKPPSCTLCRSTDHRKRTCPMTRD